MPKIRRILEPEVYYHVTIRGNNQQTVFSCPRDYRNYLTLLKKYKLEFCAKLFGYCLMPNHVHMVIYVDTPSDLPDLMHRINMLYARWFNRIYNKNGHLWESRYYSSIISNEQYLTACIQYIENNPVRANLVVRPEHWEWSSFNTRTTGQYNDGLLDQIPS